VWLEPGLAAIRPDTRSAFDDYFAERTLARWLEADELPETVYAFPKTGVQPLRAIVGGITAARHGIIAVPSEWRKRCEPLPAWAALGQPA
jgi:hypothetical protein